MLSAKIAYRNLPRRKARTILTVTAVVLGVALLVGINMATASAQSEFNGYINKFWGQTDLVVGYSSPLPFGPGLFEAGNETIVQNVTGVQQTAERLDWAGSLDNSTFFQLAGVDGTDFDFASLNVTGAHTLSTGQAVIGSTLAEKYRLAMGSTLKIFSFRVKSLSPLALGNSTLTVQVVGIDYPLRNLGSIVYVYLPQLQTVTTIPNYITHILVTIHDPSQASILRDKVQNQLSPLFEVSAPKAEAAQRIQGQMAGFQLGLNVMVGVALVVCSFIVFNTLFMSVSERTYEIGVMRAVGTSRRQVFDVFLGEGLFLGLLGGTVGLFAGFGLSRLFTQVAETLLGIPSLPVTQLTLGTAVQGLAAGLGSVSAGAVYPAVSASRIDIIQAIRPKARDRPRRVPDWSVGLAGGGMLLVGSIQAFRVAPVHVPYLDIVLIPLGLVVLGALVFAKAGRILSLPVRPLSGGLAYLMSRGNRRRLVRNTVCFGMIGVTLSFVIMLGGIQAGVQVAVEQGIKEALGADIFLVANQSIDISFTNQLTSLPQVSTATPLGFSLASSKAFGPDGQQSSVGILAVDPSVFPSIIAYNFLGSTSSVQAYAQLAAGYQSLIMPDSLANKTGVGVGDTLSVAVTGYGLVPFRVAGIFNGPVLQYLQFGESFASDSIIVSFKSQQEFFGGKMQASIFLVDLKPGFKSASSIVAHDISVLFPRYDFAENSVTLNELLALVRGTIDRIFALILLVLYFALLIATLGIGATMVMNVADRRREIGLLRSQGVSRGGVLGLFLWEGVTLGLFGFCLAAPGGLLLLKGATESTTIAGFWLPFIVPWGAMTSALPLALAAVLVGSVYPAFRASKMEITKALEQV